MHLKEAECCKLHSIAHGVLQLHSLCVILGQLALVCVFLTSTLPGNKKHSSTLAWICRLSNADGSEQMFLTDVRDNPLKPATVPIKS